MDEYLTGSSRPWHEAWIKYILEFPMPDVKDAKGTKEELVSILEPVMNVSAKSNILRREIPMHLDSYDIIWDKYFAYMKRGKYDPRLLVLHEALREGFELHLNRSIDATQMRMIFEPKQNVFQRLVSGTEQKLSWFKSRKTEENNKMDGEK